MTKEGNIVISVRLFGDSDDTEVWEGMSEDVLTKTKEMLEDTLGRRILSKDKPLFISDTGKALPAYDQKQETSLVTFVENSNI